MSAFKLKGQSQTCLLFFDPQNQLGHVYTNM